MDRLGLSFLSVFLFGAGCADMWCAAVTMVTVTSPPVQSVGVSCDCLSSAPQERLNCHTPDWHPGPAHYWWPMNTKLLWSVFEDGRLVLRLQGAMDTSSSAASMDLSLSLTLNYWLCQQDWAGPLRRVEHGLSEHCERTLSQRPSSWNHHQTSEHSCTPHSPLSTSQLCVSFLFLSSRCGVTVTGFAPCCVSP